MPARRYFVYYATPHTIRHPTSLPAEARVQDIGWQEVSKVAAKDFGRGWTVTKEPLKFKPLTPSLHEMVRSYCKRERADVPVDSPEMVADWLAICRKVGVRTKGKWE